ncbi:Anaphase spindle elongation protein 1 [Tolypocladium paradoxum]|uniref:Anaphase spindle elongation protein 1 n=1 Tax=Tolypocladium paradoxum TaxID=94208 RepID=A0A2S4KTY0_9HYPO|nr:Anaphase spindle elongation protein 1 [Tolypocladium paradoxum]
MDNTSYLAQQVNGSIGQLHGLFDEIGVPSHEREAREAELFTALSDALNSQVRLVTAEKKEMVDEAKRIITTIRQMEASLDDSKPSRRSHDEDDEFRVTYPLTRCLQALKEKHVQISRLHKERFEQVKKLVEALESYSSHLEPTFVQIALPPTGPNQSIPTTFDLSPSYVDRLDVEFTRVYEEYTRRIASVQALSDHIIQLWAELGIPQAQQDGAIVKYYRDAPEQLGLHEEDISRLQTKRDRLAEEKKSREKRLRDLKAAVEALWVKLGVDQGETKVFLNQNRGCGVRQINEFEDELARLNELKRQNLHLFVEDARVKLQDLWDALYFSEDEMLEFTPAFSDVYSDALLEAHEREVARLEALREQRAPTLALIDKHKGLIRDRDELATSSQDASRLMMRGQKGEKRDPGKLLREEKMRKRIAKELPKVTAEVRKVLEQWEDEYSRPFLVFGERYLDELEVEETTKGAPTTRCKTPAGPPPSTAKGPKAGGLSRANSTKSIPPRSMNKTPTTNGPAKKSQGKGSPSKIPARAPLSSLKHGNNSPERRRPESRAETLRNGAPLRAPPPKMRDLESVPELETPINTYKSAGIGSIVRPVEPEDVYDDRPRAARITRSNSNLSHHAQPGYCEEHHQYDDGYDDRCDDRYATPRAGHQQGYAQAPPPRQISNTSNTSTAVSGSENWETYDDNSEPEPDASEAYYAKLRAARGKRYEPEQCPRPSSQAKRIRGIPPPQGYSGPVMIDQEGNRTISGSEWTDEDAF